MHGADMLPPDTAQKLQRPLLLSVAAALLLSVSVLLGVTLGASTQSQFTEVEDSWADYSGGAERKGELISALRGFLGYGGIIHNFKNYVLRQDEVYFTETQRQLTQFHTIVDAFQGLDLTDREANALQTISATVLAYEQNLTVAQRAIEEELGSGAIDRRVRIDDSEALAALSALEAEWRRNQERSTARIFAAVAEGNTLIWIGYWSILALLLAALSIGALVYLLIRDLRLAVTRLQSELHARRRLQQSQERLATIVEQSPTTIVMTDTDARIQYVNETFERLTGWSRADVMGQTPAFLQSGETKADTYTDIRKALEHGKTWHGVFRNRRKDGSSYWAETTLLPLTDQDGRVQNFVGIGEDVTETRRAREHVVRAQKLEAVGQLAGGVAHDFNNILTTIVGASHLAAMDAPDGSDLANEVRQIDIAARRAQHLVRELLTFARREPAEPKAIILKDIVEEVVILLRASIPPTVTLDIVTSEANLAVLADETHLHQITMNLCRNAAEALSGKPGQISIEIEKRATPPEAATPAPHWVLLRVSDNGPGMSAQTQEHLFEPFFTTKPLGKGSGLGLAVVLGLIEDMGGSIEVESTLGYGTTFEVMLPGIDATPDQQAAIQEPLPRGNERLLLVDDETEVAGAFRRQLMRLGYRVDAFTAPLQALERFRVDPMSYDLVISDMVMPDLNGQELAESIRALRPDIPVIFCSAYRPEDIVLTGDAPRLLHKPVDPGHFARQVRTALDEPSQL